VQYQAALKQDPSLTALLYKVGRAYSEQSDHAKAVEWYRKAIGKDTENPMPFYYLGFAYKEKGRKREAITAFKEYLARRPDAEDKKDIEDEIYDLEH
jgi:cellulose synthase operon protein C